MRSTVAIPTILAHSVLVKALPSFLPDTAFSVDLVRRSFHDANRDHEERTIGGIQTSVTVTNLSSTQQKWTIDVVIGGQTLPVVFDTGSQDIWFETNLEAPNMTSSGIPKYTPTPTSSISGSTFAAHFDSDATPVAQGVAYWDTLAIGAATITSQVVGAVTSINAVTTQKKAGILGLSAGRTQSNYNTSHPPSVMSNLISQLNVTQFALDLRYDNSSRLDFGFIDSSRYNGSITWANRYAHNAAWFITLDSTYYVNNTRQTGNMSSDNNHTMVDSGSPDMAFPTPIIESYYKSLSYGIRNGSYYFDCGYVKNNTLPSFGITVNGTVFTVPGTWMWASQSGSTCYGALQSSGSLYTSLGDPFLRTVFAVFDTTGDGRVGFAAKNMPARPLPH